MQLNIYFSTPPIFQTLIQNVTNSIKVTYKEQLPTFEQYQTHIVVCKYETNPIQLDHLYQI